MNKVKALVFGAVVVVSTLWLALPASAAWNQTRYDECRKNGLAKRYCCEEAGGKWVSRGYHDKYGNFHNVWGCDTRPSGFPAPSSNPRESGDTSAGVSDDPEPTYRPSGPTTGSNGQNG